MKHISFDQSSVLQEFARIAYKKGLIKTAEEVPMGVGSFETQKAPAPQTGLQQVSLKAEIAKYPNLSGYYVQKFVSGKKFIITQQLLKEIQSGAMKVLHTKLSQDAEYNKLSNALKGDLEEAGVSGDVLNAIIPGGQPVRQMMMADDTDYAVTANNDTAYKTADEKLYDISGETGEQLVDKAHPGGGTYTEVSSKTKENLVETIVEQQKVDVEVANSIPKGTYAALVSLRNDLAKMGYKVVLEDLDKTIKLLATPELVMKQELAALANELDNLGFEKAADQVDAILKKKAYDVGRLKVQLQKAKDDMASAMAEAAKAALPSGARDQVGSMIDRYSKDPIILKRFLDNMVTSYQENNQPGASALAKEFESSYIGAFNSGIETWRKAQKAFSEAQADEAQAEETPMGEQQEDLIPIVPLQKDRQSLSQKEQTIDLKELVNKIIDKEGSNFNIRKMNTSGTFDRALVSALKSLGYDVKTDKYETIWNGLTTKLTKGISGKKDIGRKYIPAKMIYNSFIADVDKEIPGFSSQKENRIRVIEIAKMKDNAFSDDKQGYLDMNVFITQTLNRWSGIS